MRARPFACCRADKGWFNAGYIFPEGFLSRVHFRSSVALEALCVHECAVVGAGGPHWPAPPFVVTALDRPSEPLTAKSCTGCWSAVKQPSLPYVVQLVFERDSCW